MSNTSFNVMDVVNSFDASDDSEKIKELFTKEPKPEESIKEEKVNHNSEENQQSDQKKKMWVPDQDLIGDMNELHAVPVTYSQEELEVKDTDLQNIADEMLKDTSLDTMNELARQEFNIKALKKRHNIELKIPDGELKVCIINAASDTNFERAQKKLDEIIETIRTTYPQCIFEKKKMEIKEGNEGDEGNYIYDNHEEIMEEMEKKGYISEASEIKDVNSDININIDKTNVSQISWTNEELEKIKKAHIINLKIEETNSIHFSEIENIEDENEVNKVLSLYTRKTNDIDAPLPSSRYRATFTGLSYPELLDLMSYQKLDNIDAEYQKWTIVFHHIKNPSIGPWREYRIYKDPNINKKVEITMDDTIPEGVDPESVHTVSKFEDFLRKTSFLDLDFMIWKILCATSLDKEILTIDCHQKLENGQECGNSYDWIYSPNELLLISEIDPAILEEMKTTSEVSGLENILANYRSSLLIKDSLVDLQRSGYKLIFGHIDAYHYLEDIYPFIKNKNVPLSRSLNSTALTIVKGILIPKTNRNGYYRITGSENILKILDNLDEVDWLTVSEILRIVREPYELHFAIRDIVCPKCKKRSSIDIEDISDLLFTIAQSLSAIQIELKSD